MTFRLQSRVQRVVPTRVTCGLACRNSDVSDAEQVHSRGKIVRVLGQK